METNPSKIEDALEATHPEQFEVQAPAREDGTPDVPAPKVDLTQPQTWVRVPGPQHIPNLPKPGDIRIEWHLTILNSEGLVHASDDVQTKRGIDGPNHAKTVALSIQKVLEGGLYEPMLADVQAYGQRRLDEIAKKTQTFREAPVPQITTSSSVPSEPPPFAHEQPLMPPPPNPSAKI